MFIIDLFIILLIKNKHIFKGGLGSHCEWIVAQRLWQLLYHHG
jgi:hypothetical protein